MLILLFFLTHAADWYRFEFLTHLDNFAYDKRLLLTLPGGVDRRLVIVDIDEKSLAAEGRWPWGRDKLARLVTELFENYEIELLGFDIVFAEPDRSSGLDILEHLAAVEFKDNEDFHARLQLIRPQLDFDGMFGETILEYPVVLGYYFNFSDSLSDSVKTGVLPPPVFPPGSFDGRNVKFFVADGYGGNLQEIQTSALGGGHFNPIPDPDGVIRRVPMLIEYEGAYYASLSLEIARRLLNVNEIVPRFETPRIGRRGYPGLEWLQLGERAIPVDRHVQSLVPYRGRRGSFAYVSAGDVLKRVADPEILRGAVVLVGATAPGLGDRRTTPVDENFPGVEVHANLITGIMDENIKLQPQYIIGLEVVLLTIFGLVAALLLPMLSPGMATAGTVLLVLSYIGVNLAFWTVGGLVVPLATGLLMLALMYVLNMSYGYFVETRGKRLLTGLFGQYVPPTLVDEMAKSPGAYSLAAESREMTVLFSDVRGFTNLSEILEPQTLSDLMHEFLSPMTRVIHERRGTIDKYMGDAIMAFWGAPVDDTRHALHAIQAGLDMLQRMAEINEHTFVAKGWPRIQIGVGINTGVMSVGNMGSEFRVAYTVLGDAVNSGSRLEGLTKHYCVPLIVSEATKAGAPEYACRELDRVRVQGKDKAITIYEPLCLREELDAAWKDELKLYREALRMYRAQDWDTAEMNFLNLKRVSRAPGLYDMYAKRIANFRDRNPPGVNWDGVFDIPEK